MEDIKKYIKVDTTSSATRIEKFYELREKGMLTDHILDVFIANAFLNACNLNEEDMRRRNIEIMTYISERNNRSSMRLERYSEKMEVLTKYIIILTIILVIETLILTLDIISKR